MKASRALVVARRRGGWSWRGHPGVSCIVPCDQNRSVAKCNQLNNKQFHCFRLETINGNDRLFLFNRAMEGMSEREYSAHSGLSRGAIQKARKRQAAGGLQRRVDQRRASDVRRADMTDPDQQRRSTGGERVFQRPGDSSSYLKARTALTVYQAQDKQLASRRRRARWSTARGRKRWCSAWPGRNAILGSPGPTRVAALMAARSGRRWKTTGAPVIIEAAILQRVLEAHVRQHLDALADLRVRLG
jgi:hypothetical protein